MRFEGRINFVRENLTMKNLVDVGAICGEIFVPGFSMTRQAYMESLAEDEGQDLILKEKGGMQGGMIYLKRGCTVQL